MMTQDWQTMDAGDDLDMLMWKRMGRDLAIQGGPYIYMSAQRGPRIPRFSTDVSDALALVDQREIKNWELFSYGDQETYWCCLNNSDVSHLSDWEYEGTANTPALAICRAWLAWKDGQDAA